MLSEAVPPPLAVRPRLVSSTFQAVTVAGALQAARSAMEVTAQKAAAWEARWERPLPQDVPEECLEAVEAVDIQQQHPEAVEAAVRTL